MEAPSFYIQQIYLYESYFHITTSISHAYYIFSNYLVAFLDIYIYFCQIKPINSIN
jgi:hypothetical protein